MRNDEGLKKGRGSGVEGKLWRAVQGGCVRGILQLDLNSITRHVIRAMNYKLILTEK